MNEFYILNSKSEYFSGMMYGGEFVWCNDIKEAKTFNEESKFIGLQRFCTETLTKLCLDLTPSKREVKKKLTHKRK